RGRALARRGRGSGCAPGRRGELRLAPPAHTGGAAADCSLSRDRCDPIDSIPAGSAPGSGGASRPEPVAGGRRRGTFLMVTRLLLAGGLVTLLFLGCAAGPNSGGIAPESGTAAERNRAAMERPADPVAYLHLVRAQYAAEAGEWPQAVSELRLAIDRDPKSAAPSHQPARSP